MKISGRIPIAVRESGFGGERFTLNGNDGGEIYVQDWGSRGGGNSFV